MGFACFVEGVAKVDRRAAVWRGNAVAAADVMKGVDAVIVTHTHDDHWDEAAAELLPKNLPIITQHQADADKIRSQGFTNVSVLNGTMDFNGIKLSKTGGAHGTVEMYAVKPLGDALGDAMGVVFQAPEHKTVYVMGDTVWTADVNKALNHYQPDVLVMNTGDVRLKAFPNEGIIMSKADVQHAALAAPKAKIIAVHMDAVNHTTVSSKDLREYVKQHGLQNQVSVPKEGEVVKF